jgi:hypothetical protein
MVLPPYAGILRVVTTEREGFDPHVGLHPHTKHRKKFNVALYKCVGGK